MNKLHSWTLNRIIQRELTTDVSANVGTYSALGGSLANWQTASQWEYKR